MQLWCCDILAIAAWFLVANVFMCILSLLFAAWVRRQRHAQLDQRAINCSQPACFTVATEENPSGETEDRVTAADAAPPPGMDIFIGSDVFSPIADTLTR
ncbi:hypothetical protein F4804DRAFT_338234 [Jackrogersella minutella]|nr:hypothetical protein F4804DRAFT_338234 [Jackrogersella minutella]